MEETLTQARVSLQIWKSSWVSTHHKTGRDSESEEFHVKNLAPSYNLHGFKTDSCSEPWEWIGDVDTPVLCTILTAVRDWVGKSLQYNYFKYQNTWCAFLTSLVTLPFTHGWYLICLKNRDLVKWRHIKKGITDASQMLLHKSKYYSKSSLPRCCSDFRPENEFESMKNA